MKAIRKLLSCLLLLVLAPSTAVRAADEPAPAATAPEAATGTARPRERAGRLSDLTLEELMDVETTSVSRKPQKWSEVPAAIYVITREDIRRSGVTSLPDALRLAPGVQVARIDANKWAVGIRGFASRLSRSVLVLIDGRAVYSPLFAGTYWEVQDTLLEDVERIEVIRGPGGSIYGANAVNGVINIITKSSRDTQGVYATAGAGEQERGFAGFRYGGKVDDSLTYRIYGKFFDRDAMFHRTNDDFDRWRQAQGGFRVDWDAAAHDRVTLQGDMYAGSSGQRSDASLYTPPFTETLEAPAHLGGGNLLSRYTHDFEAGSDLQVQAYYDRTQRHEPTFREERDTFDLQFQQRFPLPLGQEIIYGLEYRLSAGLVHAIPTIAFVPARRTEALYAAFVQDEITLVPDRLKLQLGSKFEHNDYSGFEAHPSGRLAFTPFQHHLFWAAVSRAVRTPSRLEQDLRLDAFLSPVGPTFARLQGDRKFDSEELLATEAGYRFQPVETVSIDLAAFYNRYSDLLSIESGGAPFTEQLAIGPPHTILPFVFRNNLAGPAYGAELAADWAITDWWQLHGSYSFLKIELQTIRGSADHNTESTDEGSSPINQFTIRSYMDLPRNFELDVIGRFVEDLSAQRVGGYGTVDVHLGWRPAPNLELAIVGQNLVEDHHAEFSSGGTTGVVAVRRTAYFAVTWRW